MIKEINVLALMLVLCFYGALAEAAGWTNWAAPTQIDLVGVSPSGIMIYGAFGNPGPCTTTDRFFVPATHPQYSKIYAMALAAQAARREIRGYVSTCQAHAWYSNSTTTYGFVNTGDAVSTRN